VTDETAYRRAQILPIQIDGLTCEMPQAEQLARRFVVVAVPQQIPHSAESVTHQYRILITNDKAMRTRQHERAAFVSAQCIGIVLPGHWNYASLWERARFLCCRGQPGWIKLERRVLELSGNVGEAKALEAIPNINRGIEAALNHIVIHSPFTATYKREPLPAAGSRCLHPIISIRTGHQRPWGGHLAAGCRAGFQLPCGLRRGISTGTRRDLTKVNQPLRSLSTASLAPKSSRPDRIPYRHEARESLKGPLYRQGDRVLVPITRFQQR
jgi:hypothetical protein